MLAGYSPINIVLHTIAFHMIDALMTYVAPRVAFKSDFLPGVGCDVRLPEVLLKIVLVTFSLSATLPASFFQFTVENVFW